jgi:hypothetical protein
MSAKIVDWMMKISTVRLNRAKAMMQTSDYELSMICC